MTWFGSSLSWNDELIRANNSQEATWKLECNLTNLDSAYLDFWFGSNNQKTSENPSMIYWTVTHVWCNVLPPSTVESPPGQQHEPHQRTQSGGFWRWSFHSLSVANGYLRPAPLSAVCEAVEEAEVVAVAKARSHIFHGILVWVGVRELPYNDMSWSIVNMNYISCWKEWEH